MRVKIEADGDPMGTRVITEEGQDITSLICGIEWSHAAGDMPQVVLRLALVPLTGHGEARMIGPNGKDVRAIQYMDGAEDRFDGVVPMVTHGDDRVRWVKGSTG